MARIIHICLLLAALGGWLGQTAAMAMAPAPIGSGPLQASMLSMDCSDMVALPAPGKSPCKTITLHCSAAMGCAPATLVEREKPSMPLLGDRIKPALPLAARLSGRTYGPEPDPPSFLI